MSFQSPYVIDLNKLVLMAKEFKIEVREGKVIIQLVIDRETFTMNVRTD